MKALEMKIFSSWKPETSAEKLAVRICKMLFARGFKNTYIVGGYVRDTFLQHTETGAIDVATEAKPEQVSRLLQKNKIKVIPTGLKHGTVTAHVGKDDIEITTLRTEGKYLDRRRPASVRYITNPKIDAGRRDFTVNAFYFNPLTKEVFDFNGGFADLAAGRLRFVGNAVKRIHEDALRLMRAVRFTTTLDFVLAPADLSRIKKYAKLITEISPERVKQELDKIVLSPRRAEGMKLLHRVGLLKYILPEVEALLKTPQSKNYHSEGNVFVHTMLALSQVANDASLNTLYGLLFHDLGKAPTARRVRRHGRPHVTFYDHQNEGVKLAQKILRRLRFSNSDSEEILWYIKNHHVPYELSKMRRSKQMFWALDPRFENLLKLYRADSLSSIPTDKRGRAFKPSLESYNYSLKTLKSARAQENLSRPLVNGSDVMRILKIKEGPGVGRILAVVREAQLAGRLKNFAQATRYIKAIKSKK